MSEPTTSTDPVPPVNEDEAIRQRVKGLTSQVLQQGRLDPEAVRDVVRTVIGRTPGKTDVGGADAEELFAGAARELDDALMKSASATHSALQLLASRGKDFTDNDLKEALVSLRKLEEDCEAAANRITEAMSGNLRREMTELAVHAQNIGVLSERPCRKRGGGVCQQHACHSGAGDGARCRRPHGVACQRCAGRRRGRTTRSIRDKERPIV
jgi:hypothetical protein